MSEQQGDVRLVQTNDDGDIDVVNGIVAMDGGLETSVYLAMFGGNEDDSTSSWWGNSGELEVNKYHSVTQELLQSLPATSCNLLRIEDAVNTDLAYLTSEKIASLVEVTITIPELNRINIKVVINADGIESEFNFTENWKALS